MKNKLLYSVTLERFDEKGWIATGIATEISEIRGTLLTC